MCTKRRNERGTRKLDRQSDVGPSIAGDVGYDARRIEVKWQRIWAERDIYRVDLDAATRPHYNLTEFPYPSAEGLHVGHVSTYSGADVYGRMLRMRGRQVFQPMGWDAFGIHSENYALKVGRHPTDVVPRNIARFKEQLGRIGLGFDWSRELDTTSPRYYRWTQWILCKLIEGGLGYRAERAVNWCPSCKTTLAHEQVVQGRCERCDSRVISRRISQWFLKTTAYAERLLDFSGGDFSPITRTLQTNWIGRQEGTRIAFDVRGSGGRVEVFSTRAETLYGATFLALAPDHPLAPTLAAPQLRQRVRQFIEAAAQRAVRDRHGAMTTDGIDTGAVAINPVNGRHLPIWLADYVMADMGTGAIFGVPAHDSRDHAFAMAHGLPMIGVVAPDGDADVACSDEPLTGPGVLVDFGPYTGLPTESARSAMVADLCARGVAEPHVAYRLHDWNVSRQRYWGPPIPIITCPDCGDVTVPEADLPVLLPYMGAYRPLGDGRSPLDLAPGFGDASCPRCGGSARRETDVSDNFVDSAWYFMRYLCTECDDRPWDSDRLRRWLPVSMYFGGQEHSTMHHLYARFLWKALQDLGHVPQELGPEPFAKLRLHGMIVKDGAKMSKSRGNVINPDDYVDRYGADALRMYLLFMAPFDRGGDFRDKGIHGMTRFLAKVYRTGMSERPRVSRGAAVDLAQARHRAVQVVQRDIEDLAFNTALAELMRFMTALSASCDGADEAAWDEAWSVFLRLLAPFAPHLTEELWQRRGGAFSIHRQPWPEFDPLLAEPPTTAIAVQVDGKVRDSIEMPKGAGRREALDLAMSSSKVQARLAGREIARVIHVPDRIINLVTRPV